MPKLGDLKRDAEGFDLKDVGTQKCLQMWNGTEWLPVYSPRTPLMPKFKVGEHVKFLGMCNDRHHEGQIVSCDDETACVYDLELERIEFVIIGCVSSAESKDSTE